MPLHLIHGPPNSGRAGLIRRGFAASLDRDPVLVVPTLDDVFSFEREICEGGAALGGAVMTFRGLFSAVAAAAGSPPAGELSEAQRLRVVELAVAARRGVLGPLRRSASRPGFAPAFERLLDELQAAGLEPGALAAGAATLEGSAYLGDLVELFGAYAELRERLGRTDSHEVAREAAAGLRSDPDAWRRPVFLYGLDDLTRNQFELIAALAESAEVTFALPYEEGSAALAARGALLARLRELGPASETVTDPDPANTPNPALFDLERGFGRPDPPRHPPRSGLTVLRSAGERGEAEAIGAAIARRLAEGVDPGEIAIAVRDPARRGPLLASVLGTYGVATALEAELPVTSTAVGGTLVALLSAELGEGRLPDLLRFMRGPSGLPAGQVDWFERAVRRDRVRDAAAALKLWEERHDRLPDDVARVRAGSAAGPGGLLDEIARLAQTMAARPLRDAARSAETARSGVSFGPIRSKTHTGAGGDGGAAGAGAAAEGGGTALDGAAAGTVGDGAMPAPGEGIELRAAAAIAAALGELAEVDGLAPRSAELAETIAALRLRAWSGPIEGRVRIASPYGLRAGRFDDVFVASLQDDEFPRRERGGDPFLSEAQRETLGLDPRRDVETEERYLFHACLALPRQGLWLSHRYCDENGAAEAPSPFLAEVRELLDPPPREEGEPDPVEEAIVRSRDLTEVVHRIDEAPGEDDLARAVASHGADADVEALLDAAAVPGPVATRLRERIGAARRAEAASRAPGPLTQPAALAALAAVPAYGGTSLEGFDQCSYRWFVSHELRPQRLEPDPDPLVQGGLMHAALERLYREAPGGDPLPRPGSLPAWIARGRELLTELRAEWDVGEHPAERALARRVAILLDRFLAEEAEREDDGFRPWLLEGAFGEGEDRDRPALELDGWRLHGAVDRVDRDAAGRLLVLDYKLSGSVTPMAKLEEEAKLQLQLYLLAVADLWGGEPAGGLYYPLRGSTSRRPRGLVSAEAAGELADRGIARTDVADPEEIGAVLGDARRRAGEIVARMRGGDIRRDPGPRPGLRGHDVCPSYCEFAPICRRDRAPEPPRDDEDEER